MHRARRRGLRPARRLRASCEFTSTPWLVGELGDIADTAGSHCSAAVLEALQVADKKWSWNMLTMQYDAHQDFDNARGFLLLKRGVESNGDVEHTVSLQLFETTTNEPQQAADLRTRLTKSDIELREAAIKWSTESIHAWRGLTDGGKKKYTKLQTFQAGEWRDKLPGSLRKEIGL